MKWVSEEGLGRGGLMRRGEGGIGWMESWHYFHQLPCIIIVASVMYVL